MHMDSIQACKLNIEHTHRRCERPHSLFQIRPFDNWNQGGNGKERECCRNSNRGILQLPENALTTGKLRTNSGQKTQHSQPSVDDFGSWPSKSHCICSTDYCWSCV